MITALQPSLWDAAPEAEQPVRPYSGQRCHFKGCKEPVVCDSTAKRNGYVCKHHNEIEWATAMSRGKDGYWRMFGKRWLAELETRS
jgi:hypothetical protein